MGKVSGSYESVVRGVSEQNPQARRSGQHFAQVNMISDPVRGLARRHGSILQNEIKHTGFDYAALKAASLTKRVFPFQVGGVEYDLIVRTGASAGSVDTFAQVFNKATRAFIPVSVVSSAVTLALITGGVSAVANVGRYVYLAGNSIVPSTVETARWDNVTNKAFMVGWVRAGAYARTFTATLTLVAGGTITASYTTDAASYPGTLDTSDILTGDPDYQKKVNDRTNDYNTAVTQWIGTSAQSTTPENIASKLAAALTAAGAASVTADGGYVIAQSSLYSEIALDDSGDGSLVRNVGNTIKNIDLVSSKHKPGKVIKVQPDDGKADPVYLEAFATDGASTGFTDVYWRETAGYQIMPATVFCFCTVQAGTFYIASSAAALQSASGVANVPTFQSNLVGDAGSTPVPDFIGKTISYMGVFQDRLLIGSGGNIFGSRPGDYLNFFRKSVLTIADDDPVSGYALGSEDDTIRYGALYDRSLLLYGTKFQYVISGRSIITPTTFNIPVVSAYKDAVDAAPVANGNFVFYAKQSGLPGKEISSLHQVQPGLVTDVSDSYEASQQLDTYLAGKPVEMVGMTAPNFVLFRTDRDTSSMFVYNYLDNPNTSERLFDSWSTWTWDKDRVGELIGISSHKADILAYFIKQGIDKDGNSRAWTSCEKFVRDTVLSDYPYLDSLRLVADYHTPTANSYIQSQTLNKEQGAAAIGRGIPEQFLGARLDKLAMFEGQYPAVGSSLYVGWEYDAYVVPTNPYIRDRNGQAILNGRLTLGKVEVSVTDTGAMHVTVDTRNQTKESLNFTGRILGQPNDLIGRQPIVTTTLTATVGGEVNECTYKLASTRWLPLTINTIAWNGQYFNNTRRV